MDKTDLDPGPTPRWKKPGLRKRRLALNACGNGRINPLPILWLSFILNYKDYQACNSVSLEDVTGRGFTPAYQGQDLGGLVRRTLSRSSGGQVPADL